MDDSEWMTRKEALNSVRTEKGEEGRGCGETGRDGGMWGGGLGWGDVRGTGDVRGKGT